MAARRCRARRLRHGGKHLHILRLFLPALLTLLVAGCAGADDGGADAEPAVDPTPAATTAPAAPDAAMQDMDEVDDPQSPLQDDHAGFAFGAPADPSEADRTVTVEAVEAGGFAYDPPRIEVAAGETVTFEVSNAGEAVHEFVIGDASVQRAHEEEMREMDEGMMHDEPNAISLQPGETKSLTWTFTDAGELLYGCHQPGHYDAGMVGELDVS